MKKIIPSRAIFCFTVYCAVFSGSALRGLAQAQNAASSSPSVAPVVSLSVAFGRVNPASVPLAIAIAAERTFPIQSRNVPAPPASLQRIAATYGVQLQTYGRVTAVAPMTADILRSPSAPPNVYRDLPPSSALKLLLSRLSPAQWLQLTSAQGLGRADLSSTELQELFIASIPSRQLIVAPIKGTDIADDQRVSYAHELMAARLRIGQAIRVGLPIGGGGGSSKGFLFPTVPGKYLLLSDVPVNDAVHGQLVKSRVRNVLKAGEMDFDAPVLSKEVILSNAGTVEKLVALVRNTTGLEVYVDPHFGRKTVTIIGTSARVPARDILRAVALCLTGAYRRVGGAFVLTDDIVGIGTRRELWRIFQSEADVAQQRLLAPAEVRVRKTFRQQSLNQFDLLLSFTPEQVENAKKQLMPVGITGIHAPFSELTPTQQKEAERVVALVNLPDSPKRTNLSGEVAVTSTLQLELLLPSLDAPITVTQVSDFLQRYIEQDRAAEKQRNNPPQISEPIKNLGTIFQAYQRRILLANPRTGDEIRNVVSSMKANGLNELWLSIASNGTEKAASQTSMQLTVSPNRILTEAIQAVRGTGIKIYPVIDLLRWDGSVSQEFADRTILGETNVETTAKEGKRWSKESPTDTGVSSSSTYVSPVVPQVKESLGSLIANVVRTSDVAGIVIRDIAAPGYNKDQSIPELGYSQQARLQFLRNFQVDPIDITPRMSMLAFRDEYDTSLPLFDDPDRVIDQAAMRQWGLYRTAATDELLRGVIGKSTWSAVREHNGEVIVLQKQAPEGGNWFAKWENSESYVPDSLSGTTILNNDITYIKSKWSQAFIQLPKDRNEDGSIKVNSEVFMNFVRRYINGQRWDGIIWDATGNATPDKLRQLFEAQPSQATQTPVVASVSP